MKLLTTREVAEILRVTQTRVQQLILEGRLPAQKMGRDNFIKEEDLKLVADRKVGRPPKPKADKASRTHGKVSVKASKTRGGKK
jgi:excisionase family DNA binding protein